MDEYYKVIAEVSAATAIPSDEFFDYRDSPSKEEFDAIFTFYQETLLLNEGYGITPSYLYFNPGLTANAQAKKVADCYLVSINMAMVINLMTMFKDKPALLDGTDNEELIAFQELLDAPINELMYQNAIHFTFYHEMAHLIQNSEFLEGALYERVDSVVEFSIRRHNLELDADEFSALCIGSHAIQYAQHMFGEAIDTNKVEKLLIIICSSALIYMLSFRTNSENIYYEEMSHPHPIIRITRIVAAIVQYSVQALEHLGFELALDTRRIIAETIRFTDKIACNVLGINPVIRYENYLNTERENVEAYIRKTDALRGGDNSYAVHKWNVNAGRLHT